MKHRAILVALTLVALICFTGVAQAQVGTLFVKAGKVGVGVADPTKLLHINSTAGTGAGFRLSESGGGAFNSDWYFNSTSIGVFQISNFDGGSATVWIDPGQEESLFVMRGNKVGIGQFTPVAKLDVNGSIAVRSSIVHADYVFEPDYELESIEEHAAYMWEHKHLPGVGAGEYDDSGKAMIYVGERSQGVLEELEKAHVYIDQLNNQLKSLQAEVAALKATR